MAVLFKYTKNNVESHIIIRHIVEVKYDPENDIVYIHLTNGSIIDISTKSEELYHILLKKIRESYLCKDGVNYFDHRQ